MFILSFKTETSAQRARSVLKRNRIYSRVVSVDPNRTKRGCSFGLEFNKADKSEVLRLFDSNNIDYGEEVE